MSKVRTYWCVGIAAWLAVIIVLAWSESLLPSFDVPVISITVDAAGRVTKTERQPKAFPSSDLSYETGKGTVILLEFSATETCWVDVHGLGGVEILNAGRPVELAVVEDGCRIQLAKGSYRLTIKGTRL